MKEEKKNIFDIILPITVALGFILLAIIILLELKRYSDNDKEIIKKSDEYIKYKECHKINNIYYCK